MDGHTLTIVAAHWAPAAIALPAVAHDLRSREIPDWIPVAMLGVVGASMGLGWALMAWPTLIGGAAVGLLAGLLLAQFARFGGGDAKLLIAAGATAGLGNVLPLIGLIGIIGGVPAVIAMARGVRSLAYGPAIVAGLLVERLSGHWEGGLLGSLERIIGYAA